VNRITPTQTRRIAAAILRRAALDARSSNGRAAPAREWLAKDPWAGDLLAALGLNRRVALAWIEDLEPVGQPVLEI
jgi:hypothetical protein